MLFRNKHDRRNQPDKENGPELKSTLQKNIHGDNVQDEGTSPESCARGMSAELTDPRAQLLFDHALEGQGGTTKDSLER